MSSTIATRERPILFSAPMVRAIIEGRKTQTRRIVKFGKQTPLREFNCHGDRRFAWCDEVGRGEAADEKDFLRLCPYGVPGNRLWVREAFRIGAEWDDTPASGSFDLSLPGQVWYEANGPTPDRCYGRLRSPIHMPRAASRLTLEIKDVRVERLHDAGKDGRKAHDVLAEGIDPETIKRNEMWFHKDDSPALAFGWAWDAIHGDGAWRKNPWVWAITFRAVKP